MERLCRFARRRPEWVFRHSEPGFCSICQGQIPSALDVHMIKFHLELGQLWRCPVEWCTVWKGSVSDCLGYLQDKHGGSQYVAPWTMPRDLWRTSLRPDASGIAVDARLFHEVGCWLVHKHCVYKDSFPHPALWGGGVLSRPGFGHRPAHAEAYFHPCVGSAPGAGTRIVFSAWHVFTGTDGPPSCIVCQ